MKRNGWDEGDLSTNSHLYPSEIKEILSGKYRLSEYDAQRLETATNICADFWLALDEHNYRQRGKEKFLRKSQKSGQAVFAFC